jgi:hypothetical protein
VLLPPHLLDIWCFCGISPIGSCLFPPSDPSKTNPPRVKLLIPFRMVGGPSGRVCAGALVVAVLSVLFLPSHVTRFSRLQKITPPPPDVLRPPPLLLPSLTAHDARSTRYPGTLSSLSSSSSSSRVVFVVFVPIAGWGGGEGENRQESSINGTMTSASSNVGASSSTVDDGGHRRWTRWTMEDNDCDRRRRGVVVNGGRRMMEDNDGGQRRTTTAIVVREWDGRRRRTRRRNDWRDHCRRLFLVVVLSE